MHKAQPIHNIEEVDFLSAIGGNTHIYGVHFLPKEKLPKKIIHVIFQHGMIEYHKRHMSFINSLREEYGKSIVISCMDLVGHGLSGGNRAYIDTFLEDSFQFFDICHKRFYKDHNVEKTFYISHSLGGLISLRSVTHETKKLPFEIDSLILTNPCIAPKIELPKKIVSMIDALPETISKLRIPLIYNAYDLTHDDESAIEFMHDHLISKSITIKLGVETLIGSKSINSLSYFLKYPCLFILSGDDKVVDNEKAELFITGMDKKKVEVQFYANMKHDILNESCRSDVFRGIINYMNKRRNL
jgi:alpha-beta hydrolase superfamily lysophospholipase